MRLLVTIEFWTGPLVAGYYFEAVSLPPGESHEQCEAESVIVPSGAGHLWFRVYSSADRAWLAWAIFGADGSTVQCCDIKVEPDHRRNGIASALYRWAARFFDAPVIPSDARSNCALAFWSDRDSIRA